MGVAARGTHRPGWRASSLAIALGQPYSVMLLVAATYVLTLQPGHDWGDDFAMYIALARNIADGHAYGATGYVYNALFPDVGPRLYPPVFPLMLAPVYKVFGLNLIAIKAELVAVFVLALAVIHRLFSRGGSGRLATVTVAIIGFNPYVWGFKDEIVSDLPFVLFAFTALLVGDWLLSNKWRGWRTVLGVLLLGACLYCAYGTRVLGLVLVPSLALTEIVQRRRVPWGTLSATAVLGCACAIQAVVVAPDYTYFDQIGTDAREWIRTCLSNLPGYFTAFGSFWSANAMTLPVRLLVAVLSALAAVGVWTEVRTRVRVWTAFGLFYAIGVGLWPTFGGTRLLIPLLPLFVYYVVEGAYVASTRFLGDRRARLAVGGVLAAVAATYALTYAQLATRTPEMNTLGVRDPAAQELFAFVRSGTEPDSIMVFRKPRALALFTDRPVAVFPRIGAPQTIWPYVLQIHAEYVVLGLGDLDEPLMGVIADHRQDLDQVFRNTQFTVYRVKSSSAQ